LARFKETPLAPDQLVLISQSVDDMLDKDSDVRSFADVMNCLDYGAIESKCSVRGCPPYPPREMVKVLVYAYSKGIRSSRKIEELLKVDIRFLWLSGGIKPDHNTIARFRKANYEELADLFKMSVRICVKAGLATLKVVATDGTKLTAAASRRRIYNAERLERALTRVDEILKEAKDVDCAEADEDSTSSPGGQPDRLKDAKERKTYLEAIFKGLKEINRKNYVATDPDCRVMRTTGGNRPAYNVQACVDNDNQVIVAMKLTQAETDYGLLPEMTSEIQANTGSIPDVSLADCGYCDEPTLRWIGKLDKEVLMPIREQHREAARNDLFASKCFIADESRDVLICPAGRELTFRVEHFCNGGFYRQYAANGCQDCSFYNECVKTGKGSRRINVSKVDRERKAMKEKLESDRGKALFKLRCSTVEPVFGQCKHNRKLDRFLCWGINGAKAESALMALAHNILKCLASEEFLAHIPGISPLIGLLKHQISILRTLNTIFYLYRTRSLTLTPQSSTF
jgi:transposase